ncbi:hypothetical protein [Dactylosporangium sp. NPDC048998]|uniref:hypothetical protein n=1 Tax=Dactylosporangium sp. NPDC048998 TaxID=3363976 RepID=UPI003712DFA6
MTVLHDPDGTDFSLVCDGCGTTIDRLGANLHNWELAWSLVRRHGWVGERSRQGPHGCPKCTTRSAYAVDG